MGAAADLVVCRLKSGPTPKRYVDPAALAIKAITFIGSDRERLRTFLDATGIEPHALRATASLPSFLPSVLDYILDNDRLVLGLASFAGIEPEAIWRARNELVAA